MNSLALIFSNFRYFSPVWVFASLNIMTSTWVLYIPHVKEKLAIDDAELGVALFCFATGTLLMVPLSSKIIKRVGVGLTTIIGIIIFTILYLVPVLVSDYRSLCISLFFVGLFACLTDVAMNSLVSEIELSDKAYFMSAAHGFFSLGGVLGAGIGSFLIIYFELPIHHMLSIALFVLISNILISKNYISIKGTVLPKKDKLLDLGLIKPLFGLTIIAFLIMGSEGAIEHWSKLYLQDILNITSDRLSGLGFVLFSIAMTLGRFFGDKVSKNYGSMNIIITGCLVSSLGLLAILSSVFILSMFGFLFVGLGFSVIIPELFRLAGKTKGVTPAEGISFVAGFGYVGFLASPPFLGFLSKLKNLQLSFTALLVAASLALCIAGFLKLKRKSVK